MAEPSPAPRMVRNAHARRAARTRGHADKRRRVWWRRCAHRALQIACRAEARMPGCRIGASSAAGVHALPRGIAARARRPNATACSRGLKRRAPRTGASCAISTGAWSTTLQVRPHVAPALAGRGCMQFRPCTASAWG
eukprot:365632-Chlamydomonas_euryale.AAC.22